MSLLTVAVLIGKVVLLSFVVAPILAKALEREIFAVVARRLFPAYYALAWRLLPWALRRCSCWESFRGRT